MKTAPNLKLYPLEGGGHILTDLDLLPRCTLNKMQSDDGKWRFNDEKAFIGKEYIYSPKSRCIETIHHVPTNTDRECEIVMVYDERGFFGVMPTECLEF